MLISEKIDNVLFQITILITICIVKYLFDTHLKHINLLRLCSFLLGGLGFYTFNQYDFLIDYLIISGLISAYLLMNKNKLFDYINTFYINELGPILLIFFVGNLIYPLYMLTYNVYHSLHLKLDTILLN